ncbi:MAG: VCBS repeat-containing protein [Thermoanaerobaculia bacterium]
MTGALTAKDSIRRPAASAFALLTGLSAALLTPLAAGAQDWIEYVDETSTRVVIDAAVGIDDDQEKDLAAGDVDNDGDPDVVVARKLPFSNTGGLANVLLINEDGVLTDRTATLAPGFLDATDDRDIALVDVDGDGRLDVVTVTTFGEQPRIYMNLGGDPWQGFALDGTRLPVFNPGPKFCSVGFGDVTGNGRPDLYFADYENSLEDRLLINDGDGFFSDETATRLTPEMAESVFGTDAEIHDMNGDGFNDIVKNNASGNSPPPGSSPSAVRILYNDGSGHFDFMQLPYTIDPYMFEIADFNGDGRNDIFVVDDAQDAFLLNTGNDLNGRATFSTDFVTNSPNTANFGGNTESADLDKDGILDIAVTDVDTDIPGCGRRLVLLRGEGVFPDVGYSDPLGGSTRPWTPNGTFDVVIIDVDGDAALDLFVGTCDGYQLFSGRVPSFFSDGFESGDTSAW